MISIYTLPEENKLWAECKTGDITDCVSYEYEKFFNGVGTFTMELPINTRFRSAVGINSVLVTSGGDELIVKNIKTTADKLTVTGYDLNGILLDRLTIPVDGGTDSFDPFEGSTEACVKHYVESNFVSSAVAERNLPRFGVAENKLDRGVADDHAMPRLQNVAELITEMCGAAGIGWRISIDKTSGRLGDVFVFDVVEEVDRTVNQSERNRVIFSIQQHNVSEMTREVGVTAAKNALYCDINGTVVQYPQAGNETRSVGVGYGRREEYCALSGDSLDPKKYGVEAEQNISDRMEETDSLVIDAGSPLDYGVLYDVGTVATVYDRERSLQLDSVISSAAVKQSGTECSVKLSLGNSKPKLLDNYQKKNTAVQRTQQNVMGKEKSSVGRASEYDKTSEYFNDYTNNVAGVKGRQSYATARGERVGGLRRVDRREKLRGSRGGVQRGYHVIAVRPCRGAEQHGDELRRGSRGGLSEHDNGRHRKPCRGRPERQQRNSLAR